jgi:hypothetical protein
MHGHNHYKKIIAYINFLCSTCIPEAENIEILKSNVIGGRVQTFSRVAGNKSTEACNMASELPGNELIRHTRAR